MISNDVTIDRREFEQRTGWELKPEGACKDGRCVPLPDPVSDTVDLTTISEHLSMPLLLDPDAALWPPGPASGGTAATSAHAPARDVPDWYANACRLSSLRGHKALLVAWASW